MRRIYQLLIAIIFSILLAQIEIIIDINFYYLYFEPSWPYFLYRSLILFSGYFYIILLIFLSYELKRNPKGYSRTISIKVLGYLLLAIQIVFFFLIRVLIRVVLPLISDIFDLISLYVGFAIMPAIFITFFVFGVKNERHYGNYATSFSILYLIYFIITLLYHFLIAPELIPGADRTLIIGSTLTTLQVLLVYLAAGYLLFFGIRIKLPHFILISISWAYYNIYRQLADLMYAIGNYIGDYIYTILLITLCFLGILISIRFFELGKRLKGGMRIFISHSVEDFNGYRVEDIANFLKNQKKIGHVYFCEMDLSGNIDKWMKKTVSKSQVLIFISTQNSLKSKDSLFELNLAREKELHLIPILGVGMQWEDLEELNLHREFGSTFMPMEFENFCSRVYDLIMKFRRGKKTEIIDEKN
ncbi:MAG: TIR domain-containing protein [Promethearchaeota archaeon]